jgi:hypothetical protein
MSEDIFSVVTSFADVASLAQGYMNRADGERLLLPLPEACNEGTGVRFVVYLADGTPAFAGAGLCAQTSDQGGTVPPAQRFETLLDSLQFDERSRPVYDYIVAVRNAAYAQQPGADEVVAADVDDGDLQGYADDGGDDEPTQYTGSPSRASERAPAPATEIGAEVEAYEIDAAEDTGSAVLAADSGIDMAQGDEMSMQGLSLPGVPAAMSQIPSAEAVARMASFAPPPIPTGLLTRPARATHWQPSPPRRPTPRPSTGLFRYAGGTLPRPSRPPRPDLDPALRVARAPQA